VEHRLCCRHPIYDCSINTIYVHYRKTECICTGMAIGMNTLPDARFPFLPVSKDNTNKYYIADNVVYLFLIQQMCRANRTNIIHSYSILQFDLCNMLSYKYLVYNYDSACLIKKGFSILDVVHNHRVKI